MVKNDISIFFKSSCIWKVFPKKVLNVIIPTEQSYPDNISEKNIVWKDLLKKMMYNFKIFPKNQSIKKQQLCGQSRIRIKGNLYSVKDSEKVYVE